MHIGILYALCISTLLDEDAVICPQRSFNVLTYRSLQQDPRRIKLQKKSSRIKRHACRDENKQLDAAVADFFLLHRVLVGLWPQSYFRIDVPQRCLHRVNGAGDVTARA